MTPRQSSPVFLLPLVAAALLVAFAARAADDFAALGLSSTPRGGSKAHLAKSAVNKTALPAGGEAMLAVSLDIGAGYHAQSHKPYDENLIPFTIKLEDNPALTFGEPVYPPGKDETYPNLGKLSVYTKNVVVRVPVKVKADAKPGPIQIKAKLRYQICDDNACYPPESPAFTIDTKIVPAGTEVQANEPELFKEADKAPEQPKGAGEPPGPARSNATASAVAPAVAPQPATIFGRELNHDAYLLAFAGAFLVGVIFNVMPCVLPVVPLKAMGFYEVSQHNRAKCLAFGAVFSAGLVASFGVLAVLIVALRVFDWGELFTKWWFIVPMVIVLVVMALSMFGTFTVNVPTALYNVTPRHDTYVGNFLFGVLTAALSTPCTFGMFVGLLAWALTQPAVVGVSLIMTVGAGMAFPYLVLSAFPELARRFPRGGAWGEVVKQFMGFLLLATAVYFASPLIRRAASQEAVWWVIFAVIAAGALFLAVRGLQVSKTAWGGVIGVGVAVLILAPSVYAVRLLTAKPFEWQPYSPEALAAARASGKVALVEFTATWCGNCHFLEATVLKSDPVVRTVRAHGVVMLKADVTNDDAPGRPLLNELSPAGAIPLTAVYGPGGKGPIQLTGIYPRAALQSAIEQASRAQVAQGR